jgi:hypothetical protein
MPKDFWGGNGEHDLDRSIGAIIHYLSNGVCFQAGVESCQNYRSKELFEVFSLHLKNAVSSS